MKSAVKWLFQKLWDEPKDKLTWYSILEQAKQMEKEQIIDAAERWKGTKFAEQYFDETYGSKRSDEIANCDIKISQTEISDEEIQKEAQSQATFAPSFIRGVEWYKEQLKKGRK